MQANLVPATPSVIAWAIRESGYSIPALATMLEVPEEAIVGWTNGVHPERGKLEALAHAVKRPFSAFLLPEPPSDPDPAVKFRSSSAAARRPLIPEERRRIREAVRLQRMLNWLAAELQLPDPSVPSVSMKQDPEHVGAVIRKRLGVSVEAQFSWSSPNDALRGWRDAAERIGITALALPMGEDSCRGFSIWDDSAPLIAINTAFLPEARVFTLIHEIAHLASRTNSACAEDVVERARAGDRVERWCDRVAAAVLIPHDALTKVLSEVPRRTTRGGDLRTVGSVAARFRVSRRAAALRLIEHDAASWSLFKSFPPQAERGRQSGGGQGLTRAELRRLKYGQRTMSVFRDALSNDVVGAGDVVDYLGMSPEALTDVASRPVASGDE
jgi:Zn-dependent peptidase ImmA (M78 family)